MICNANTVCKMAGVPQFLNITKLSLIILSTLQLTITLKDTALKKCKIQDFFILDACKGVIRQGILVSADLI